MTVLPASFVLLYFCRAAAALQPGSGETPGIGQPNAATPNCPTLAKQLTDDLARAQFMMEPEGAVGAVYEKATRAWSACADNETIAYLRLRTAELGAGKLYGYGPRPDLDWRRLAEEIAPRFPGSARIATILARASGSVETARAAVALDPTYTPARVALARAQMQAGDPVAAATTLRGANNLAAVGDGFAVLARARLDGGDTAGAIRAAKDGLRRRKLPSFEPDANDPHPLAEAQAILGMAYLKQGKRREAARELRAAADLSDTARDAIAHADPALQRELKRLGSSRK